VHALVRTNVHLHFVHLYAAQNSILSIPWFPLSGGTLTPRTLDCMVYLSEQVAVLTVHMPLVDN
jgi:hypothetical protein